MMSAMVHRGPDDEGYEQLPLGDGDQGSVAGFGFRRLAILDRTSAGHQPMFNPTTGDCLIFNGEIYNYRHLRSRLMVEGVRFRSSGDTEVLLKALSLWGERALDEIEGMFAFAFYQAATRRILLARDPVGIKPLYIAAGQRQVVFASEVRAILASGLVSGDWSPAGVAGFLMYGAPQDPLTVHRDIRVFPCGMYQWFGFNAALDAIVSEPPRRFWRFPAVDRDMSEAVAIRETREAMEASVASHLAADVKSGFFLSAGVDSTAIAALAARAAGGIATYTVGFESTSMASEVEAAARTAKIIGADHTEILLRANSIREWWDGWLATADRPSIDGLNTYIISGALKQAGATVAFSGLGADELFGGYANFTRVRWLGPLLRLAAILPGGVRDVIGAKVAGMLPRRYRTRARTLLANSGRGIDLAIELKQFLPARQLERLGLDASDPSLNESFLTDDAMGLFADIGNDPFLAVSRVETYLYMGNTLLRDADGTSMAHAVELRVPFLARSMLETAGRIPGQLHFGLTKDRKHLLRKSLADVFPAHVLARPKTGFTLPVGDWMFSQLRESCEAAVAELGNLPFLRQDAVSKLWHSFLADREHIYWMKPMLLVALGNYVANCRADTLPKS
jgi:asparagine synthase (glutamine-hydrolysing)